MESLLEALTEMLNSVNTLYSQVNDQTTQLRLLQTENTRITNGEGTSSGTNDRNGVGGTDDGGKHAGGNGAFKVFDEMPILEKINQEGSVKEYYDVEADVIMESNDVNGMIDISIGLMGIRVMSCDDKGVEDCEENVELCEVEVNEVVIVDEPMKGKVKNKSEVIVDEFVHNDGNSEDIEAVWKWFKRKNADSTCFKRKNRGWSRIVGTQCKVILRKWKFERLKWPNRKKREEPDGGTNLDTLRDGNCEIIKLEETLIRVVSSCWLLIWMGRLKFSEYMLFQTLELSLNLMFSIEFEPSFQVWFMGRQQRLKIPFEKTMENKFEMVFKLLLEFASNIHRVHDINDTRLREIDAKFGDLGLEKRLKMVKKTYLGRDQKAHLNIVWIRNIEVQFVVPRDEDQFESKVQLEPEVQPEPKPVLSIKLPELRNKLEDKHGLKKEGLIRAQLEVNTAA
ncbi:hypothetical protein Tco_0879960 [Tanacetum coccineum]